MNKFIRSFIGLSAICIYSVTVQAETEDQAVYSPVYSQVYSSEHAHSVNVIEPANLSLLGLGLVVLGFARKKHNK